MTSTTNKYYDDDDDEMMIEVPDDLICPITQELFRDPVMDKDGLTFEREAILIWLSQKGTCPLTRRVAKPSNYIRNVKKQTMVRLWHLEHPELSEQLESSESSSNYYDEDDPLHQRLGGGVGVDGDNYLFMFDIPEDRMHQFVSHYEQRQSGVAGAETAEPPASSSTQQRQSRRNSRRRRRRLFRLFR